MRVIAGMAKGHKLRPVPGTRTRPTADRVRESLFSILGERVIEANVLDLFAGTGALGIEALSRGAAWAVFVEQARQAVSVIEANLAHTRLSPKARVMPLSVARALAELGREGLQFQLILLDPPFGKGLATDTLERLGDTNLLAPGGIIVAELGSKEEIPHKVANFVLSRRERYGDSALTFWAREAGEHLDEGGDLPGKL